MRYRNDVRKKPAKLVKKSLKKKKRSKVVGEESMATVRVKPEET